jgi:Carboxypeptidase regulatory-like domain/TonB dependent receptor
MLKRIPAALAIGLVALCIFCFSTASHAQSVYGGIYGNVTDNTGAAIPGATVTVTDEAKGTSVVVQAGASGEYASDNLVPDLYTVKVTYTGFETFQANGIQVNAGSRPKIDAQLVPGGATTTVEVNADAIPVLKTDHADVSTVFSSQQVDNLPISGRNFTNLQLLLPGAQTLPWAHAADENPQGSAQIQVDGQAFGGVAFELDGTDNQDPILGIIVINPNLDAVGETRIATQNFDAEFGKAVSSIMTVQTHSGSNNFHGSAFDYRNSNANLAKDPYTQYPATPTQARSAIPGGLKNQFGGSIGGPVLKNRLFFFADYQGVRQKVGTSATSTIPTSLLANTCLGAPTTTGVPGCDLSQYVGSNGAGSGIVYQQPNATNGLKVITPYPGNVIPAAQVSPQWINIVKLLQPYSNAATAPVAGSLTGVNNNYTTSGTGLFNSNQWDERVDFTLNDKITMFERFSRFTDTLTGKQIFGAAGGPGTGLNGYGGDSTGHNDSVAVGADFAISNTLITDVRFGYYRYNIGDNKNDQSVAFASNVGIPGLNINDPITGGAPDFNVTSPGNTGQNNFGDGLAVSRCNCPLIEREDQFQLVNNWTKIIKTHSIKAGMDLRYARNLRVPSDTNRTGILNFSGGPTSDPSLSNSGGNGWGDIALGQVQSFSRYVSVSTNAKEFQKRDFFYVEDTWRATPNLTVNLGLRYEFYFPESVNAKGNGALMDYNDGTTNGYLRVAGYGNIGSNMNWSKAAYPFNPRVGIAYQMNPTTVIRSGYGRSFDIGVFGSMFGHVVTQNLPVLANQSISASSTNYAFCLGPDTPGCTLAGATVPGQPVGGGPAPNVFPTVPSNGLLPAPGFNVNIKARPDSLRMPTVDAWNLSIQKAITPTISVTAAYVGNKGTHTLSAGDGNNTQPDETALVLPAQYSIIGVPLHWDPNPVVVPGTPGAPYGIGADGGTKTAQYLTRYYGGALPACQQASYIAAAVAAGITLPANGGCGYSPNGTNGNISYYGDNQNSHFDALQISVVKQYTKGLSLNANYAWQAGYDYNSNFSTWDKRVTYGRNNDIREQQLTLYGIYDLPFGNKGMFATNVPGWANEVISGWQINPVLSWGSAEPFTLSFSECNASVGGTSAPCYPDGRAGFLKTNLSGLNPISHQKTFFQPVVPAGHKLCDGGIYQGFTCPALDTVGNVGRNTAWGPKAFNVDLSLQKNIPIHESLFLQFRMDAYNAFNIVSSGNPGGNIESVGIINSGSGSNQWPGYAPGLQPRQLQFSFRLQF